jgi:hypothetical protein
VSDFPETCVFEGYRFDYYSCAFSWEDISPLTARLREQGYVPYILQLGIVRKRYGIYIRKEGRA